MSLWRNLVDAYKADQAVTLEEVNALVENLIQDKNMFIGLAGPQKGLTYPTKERLLEIASG